MELPDKLDIQEVDHNLELDSLEGHGVEEGTLAVVHNSGKEGHLGDPVEKGEEEGK